jgi:hypothetical protein
MFERYFSITLHSFHDSASMITWNPKIIKHMTLSQAFWRVLTVFTIGGICRDLLQLADLLYCQVLKYLKSFPSSSSFQVPYGPMEWGMTGRAPGIAARPRFLPSTDPRHWQMATKVGFQYPSRMYGTAKLAMFGVVHPIGIYRYGIWGKTPKSTLSVTLRQKHSEAQD